MKQLLLLLGVDYVDVEPHQKFCSTQSLYHQVVGLDDDIVVAVVDSVVVVVETVHRVYCVVSHFPAISFEFAVQFP